MPAMNSPVRISAHGTSTARHQGMHVDVGAYESDVLLRDGFDNG